MNEKVRELRKALGLTLEKFGEKLGVGKNAISRIETGKSNLTDQMLKAICNVNWNGKRVNEEWFYGNSEEMFQIDSNDELKALVEKYQMSDLEYSFLKEYFKLEPSVRKDFFEILDRVFSVVHTSTSTEKKKESTVLDLEAKTKQYRKAPKTEQKEKELTVEEAEAAYIKSRSELAKKLEQSALSFTVDVENIENATLHKVSS